MIQHLTDICLSVGLSVYVFIYIIKIRSKHMKINNESQISLQADLLFI
ncbi:protein of unknown function [Clostridium beijerinckii]|nr:protein of unknown function [Clostridium beijerinckii]